jgi:hypothetical protein
VGHVPATYSDDPTRCSPEWAAKLALYADVYDPFTVNGFIALGRSNDKADILAKAHDRGLDATIQSFNDLFRRVATDSLAEVGPALMVARVQELHQYVFWSGDEDPGDAPNPVAVHGSLVAKLQRNISLGLLETILCLESGYHFAHDVLGLTGADLAATLKRSRQLYGSLAVLHDNDERERVAWLTGRSEPIEYPEVGFSDVISGEVRIPFDKFLTGGTPGPPQLRFVRAPFKTIKQSSPTMRCPAHRNGPGDRTWTDSMWHTLIEIYDRVGRFQDPRSRPR